MKAIELSDQQITHLLTALRSYEGQLLDAEEEGEDTDDTLNELWNIQELIRTLHDLISH